MGEAPVSAIGPADRMRLFTEGQQGLEPLWLWLTEDGLPMAYESWEKVFAAANTRVAAVFAAASRRDGKRRTAIACRPHMLRHTFALHMLVALHHALDRRFGLTPEERRHFRHVYGDPWVLVRDLLGHRSEQTTRLIYLGRARHGLRRVLDIETARAMADYLHHLGDRIHDGEAISGPAAPRLLHAARAAATRFEGMFLSPRQIHALLNDPALQVYDNPRAYLACNCNPAKALCHPSRATEAAAGHPSLDRCNPACANIARTDTHITALTAETTRLQAQIASPLTPEPIRQRLTQRAASLQQIADRHTRTRTTGKATDAHR